MHLNIDDINLFIDMEDYTAEAINNTTTAQRTLAIF